MALVKGTNSYASYDEADDYLQDRSDENAWDAATAVAQDSALVTAFHLLDNLPWIGITGTADQPMAWPRTASVRSTSRGRVINYVGTETEAPTLVKQAQYELALHIISNPGISSSSSISAGGGDISSVTVGGLSVDFSSPQHVAASKVRLPQRVLDLVEDYLATVHGSNSAPRRIS